MANIEASLKFGYLVENSTREHTWFSDEPADAGGTDKAAKPTEYLLSALASCMIITVKMYANRKEWKLDDIIVSLKILDKGEKVLIEKRIRFQGVLDEKQQKRLLDISGRCPVAKMLANSVDFKLV